MKVSVIAPVYNVEKYLRECVDSLLNQTLKDVEFIFVDDGSTDSSLEILKEYQAKDSRVQIYTQQNQFAGVARNNGFAHATGKYVIFLDSDDFFDLHMLETCYKTAEKYQTDVLLFGYDRFDCAKGRIVSTDIDPALRFRKKVFSADDLGSQVFEKLTPVPWDKFVLRSFLQQLDIPFMDIRKCNDAYWARMAALNAKRMRYIKKTLLHYRCNNSISLSWGVNRNNDCYLNYLLRLKDAMRRQGFLSDERYKRAYLGEAQRVLSEPLMQINDLSALEAFYAQAKQLLIPQIFDTEEDTQRLEPSSIASQFVHSETFRDFSQALYRELCTMRKEYVSIHSTTFRVGRKIMYIPLKIQMFLKTHYS